MANALLDRCGVLAELDFTAVTLADFLFSRLVNERNILCLFYYFVVVVLDAVDIVAVYQKHARVVSV